MKEILGSEVALKFPIQPFDVSHRHPGLAGRLALSLFFAFRLMCRLSMTPSIRLLHVHTSAGLPFFEKSLFILIGRLFRKQVLLHLHGGRFRDFWESAGIVKRSLIRGLIKCNHALIVLSPGLREYLTKTVGCQTILHVLPNAVKVETVAEELPADGKAIFLYVGHLKAEKGLLDLCAAFQSLPPDLAARCELRIMGMGDTPQNENLVRDAFQTAGLTNVKFLGLKVGSEKWRELIAADVFLLPSHSEDLPLTLLEAMAVGLPVIVTAVGAIPEVVSEGENGFLIPTGSPDILAERMILMAEHPEMRKAFGSANRDKIEREHSFAKFEQELAVIYETLLA
jgi:glycosyltransferase involved in cell wall biosynthesis